MNVVALLALQLVAFVGLAVAALGAGLPWIRKLPNTGRGERLILAMTTGLGMWGSALFLLGLANGLRPWAILAAACVLLAFAGRALLKSGQASNSSWDPDHANGPAAWTATLALLIAVLPTFYWGIFPPTGFDATMYHLPFAQAFVDAGRLAATPDLIYPVFPQLAEVLFAALLLVSGSDLTVHGVQFLALVAIALLLYHAGRRFYSPWTGVWAAALWLAHPLAHYQGASGYVDLVLVVFCVLALYAWEMWRSSGARSWLILCGAACGFAAATKYFGLIWFGLFVMLTLLAGRQRERIRGTAVIAILTVLIAGPWYLRIWHVTGNPVNPLLAPLFTDESPSRFDRGVGLAGDSPVGDVTRALARRAVDLVIGPESLPAFLWNASFRREVFNRQAPLAPWALALLPLAAIFGLKDPRLLRWVLLTLGYAYFWTTQDPRFQLPNAALMALAGAAAIHHLSRFPHLGRLLARPAAAWALAAILVSPGPLYAAYKLARHGPLPPTSPEARDAFLARELPGYEAIALLNELHGERYTLFALQGENLTYYAQGRLLGYRREPYGVDLIRPYLNDASSLHRELRALGAGYLLVIHGRGEVVLPRGTGFDRLFHSRMRRECFELFELSTRR